MPNETDIIYHPLLPKLKEGSKNKITNFTESGIWAERDFDELNKLSDSLKVVSVATQINSIPDVWARPLLFEMALYDGDHLLHRRTVAEWRGLLAVLAFKEVLGLKIRVIEASPESRNIESTWPSFLTILARMALNTNTLSPDTFWVDKETEFFPYLILNNEEPIGLLSPTTLVCTATDCFNRLAGIRWSDGRFLKDPSGKVKESEVEKTSELNEREKNKLAAWLENLHNSLSNLANPTDPDPRLNNLLGLLINYINDLGGAAGQRDVLSTSTFGSFKGIFKHLEKPIKHERDSIIKSHLQLVPSEDRKPSQKLFVVERSVAQQWNMKEEHVVVYGGVTLADIPLSGLGRERKQINGISLQDNEELCLPEDLFNEKIYLIYQESALPGAMASPGSGSLKIQNQVVTPLLPLTEKLLPFLNNEEIQKNITFEQSSHSILVRLRLKLTGPESTPKFVELRREYKKDDQITLDSVPVLEIWPNFRKSGWKLYYTYFSKTGHNTFYTKPYILEGNLSSKKISLDSEVTLSPSFPAAMLCYALDQNTSSFSKYAGLILLNIPMSAVSDTVESWRIGVDFGTTSTSVFIASDKNQGEPLIFRKELIAQVSASGSVRSKLYDEFIPGESEKIPFLSFFQEFFNQDGTQPIKIFEEGHIFFINDSKELGEIPSNVSKNLKWSEEAIDRNRATAFLEQICLHALAEVASKGGTKVSWRYSYPTSFSEIVSSGLPQKWQQIIEKYQNLTGVVSDDVALKFSESHATAVYFADELKASTKYGTICIDIGGGTSDIAIWQDDSLLYQVSVRLAGREILLNALRSKPDFLRLFGANVTLLQKLRTRPIDFYAQADALIRREGDNWLEQLPNKIGEEETKKLVQILTLGLSGLFYYIGMVLGFLIEKKKFKIEIPDIYIGGNGSKMFHWLSSGKYDPDHPIIELLRRMLYQASGQDEFSDQKTKMKIVISPNPKCEAARGLVGSKKLNVDESASQDSAVMSGESILLNGKKCDHTIFIVASSFKNSMELPTTLDRSESFLKIFNDYASKRGSIIPKIDFKDNIKAELRKRLGGEISDLANKNEREISVEPIFILSLKSLIDICLEQW